MNSLIFEVAELTRPFMGIDPFLFCAYHLDHYPAGNGQLGVPAEQLADRPLGNDFSRLHGYSMYYGHSVPGFPSHPHRGFETVTIVRKGYVDHADSLGSKARYGVGDTQWLTAGAGIQHAEMFPLLHTDKPNSFELFQIWLNLPARSKFVPPDFKMLWAEETPHYRYGGAVVEVIAGSYRPVDGSPALTPVSPPHDSWGAQPEAELALWLIHLPPGSELVLPAAQNRQNQRSLYVFEGNGLHIGKQTIGGNKLVRVDALQQLPLGNTGNEEVQILVMQGVPIGEPVAAGGPFVMNTDEELHEARVDFTRTHFGGWPWENREPTFGHSLQRFAHYAGEAEPQLPPTKQD